MFSVSAARTRAAKDQDRPKGDTLRFAANMPRLMLGISSASKKQEVKRPIMGEWKTPRTSTIGAALGNSAGLFSKY